MTRREFLGFFILGGFLTIFRKKIYDYKSGKEKQAQFWRKFDET